MRRRRRPMGLLVLAAAFLLSATQARPAPPRVLMVSYSAGYQHNVVRRPASGELSTAERVVTDLGRRSGGFEVSHVSTRDDLERLTATSVRGHGAILFFTTGELPIGATVRQAIFQAVRDGGGFVGVHSATDTWYTIPEYPELLGGSFDGHPLHPRAQLIVQGRARPATRHLGDALQINDESYQVRDWAPPSVHVLVPREPPSVDARRAKRPDGAYAMAR